MDNLETINNSIDEIREILNAECTPIDQLPDMVKSLSETASKSGFTTAFIFSIDSNPVRPTGGSFDPTTGLITGIEGWSQNIDTNTDRLYISFAIFGPNATRVTDWSIPINLIGRGDTGINGAQGPQGPQGLPGEKGDPGVSYRTVSVYTTTNSTDVVPGTPKGGHWDMKTNTISLPVTDDGTKWWASVNDIPSPKKFTGTSSTTFRDTGSPISKGSTPFRITGEDGKNGSDGRVIEFIYRLLPDYDTYVALNEFLSNPENKLSSLNEPDYIPEVNDNLNIGTNGKDSPIGINPTMQVEAVCSRTRNSIEEPGGEGSNCVIWSKGGEAGMDGDGIEYIYLVTPAEINGSTTTSNHVKELMIPTYSLDGDYQKDEFCFNDEGGFEGYDWSDEPQDVGPGKPMEGVMMRKQKDGVGQSFSDPTLGATYSEDGVSYVTSFVFTRASISNAPLQPHGGDYYHQYPTVDGSETGERNVNWEDSVPSGSNLPVGMSIRTFCSDYRYNDADGSEPKMLADNPDFQVEYSAYPGEITREKLDKFEGESTEENEEKGRASQLSEYEIEGGDDTKIKNPVWMITATRHGGEWSDGTISKIKGEKGEKGDPGASVKIEGQFDTLDQLKDAWYEYVNTGSLEKFQFKSGDGQINSGDGWYVFEDGKLYSYSGGGKQGEDDYRFDTYGFGTPIKGEPGDSAYMYIAYCNENNANTTVDLIGPGKYMGIKVTDKPLSETEQVSGSTYTGVKWEGEDGFGQEQVFLATSVDLGYNPEKGHLPLPAENSQNSEFLPAHKYGNKAYPSDKGSDTPVTPTPDYPFCGVATRKYKDGKFENGKGTDGVSALYSRGSYDGVSGVFIDLSNDLAIIPMLDGKVDPDFTDSVQTVVRVWVGDEKVSSDDFTVTGDKVIINENTVTLDLSVLTPSVKVIPLTVKLGGKTYDVSGKILQTETAYELTPKTYSIKRYTNGDKAGQLELDELTVDIWKWSDNKGIASYIPLFAHIIYTDGRESTFSTSDGRVIVSKNGVATVNLKDLLNIASIKIYVVSPNEKGEYLSNGDILSFEDITIVADGKDGATGTAGKDGIDGKSVVGKGGLSVSPKNPEINGCYRNLGDGKIYIYDGIHNDGGLGWALMVKDGNPGIDGKDGIDGTNSIIKGSFNSLDDFKEEIAGSELANRPQDLAYCYIVEGDLYVGHGTSTEVLQSSLIESSKTESLGYGNSKEAAKAKAYGSAYNEAANKALENLNSLLNNKNSSNPGGFFNGDIEYILSGEPEYSNVISTGVTYTATCSLKLVAIGNIVRSKEEGKNVGRFIGHDGISRYKSTVFKRSNTPLTDAPVGGSGDKPLPDDTTGTDGIPDGTGAIWSSYREFYSDEEANAVYSGSTPMLMVDSHGFKAAYGTLAVKDNSSLLIGLPVINNNANPDGDFSNGWVDEPIEGVDYYYMATATNDNGEGSKGTVTKIKGENGKDGKDGTSGKDGLSIFITYHDNPITSIPDKPTGNGTTGGGHTYSSNVVNWMSQKVAYAADEGDWGDPIQIRGLDGTDGKDGSGIEYIFIVTGPNADITKLHNDLLSCVEDKRYQTDNFYPNKDNGFLNSDGTDNPQDVSAEKPFEWVSRRKKIDGIWGEFSMPSLGSKYTTDGKDAFAYKTSYVFTRSIDVPVYPVGGLFADGLPENKDIGSDTVPQSGKGEIGMSYRMFRSDDEIIDDGSDPTKMTDTSKFEIIYGASTAGLSNDLLPVLPIEDSVTNYNGGYDNAETGVEFYYMATATYSNGQGSDGTITKIKGEKGDKGEDGTSVSIKGEFATIEDLQNAWSQYVTGDPETSGLIYPLIPGDGYLVGGNLGVYDGDGTAFADAGNNVGNIQGPEGVAGRGVVAVHKAFASNNDPVNYPTDDDAGTTIENVLGDYKYIGCREIIEYTDGMGDPIYYITSIKGINGSTGNDAPIIYPAGIGNEHTEYIAYSEKTPYVYYAPTEKYYMLNVKHLIIGEGEGSKGSGVNCAPGKLYEEEPIGNELESFDAIYANIGLFNQALVGKGVFHGDYMFSQEGVDASGNPKKYDEFADPKEAIVNGTFKPNVLFNSVTGAGNLKDVVVEKVNTHTIEGGIDKSITIENGEIISHNGDAVFGKVIVGNNNYGDQINVPLYKGNSSGSWETINAGGSVVIGSINAQNASGIHTITIDPGYVKFKTEITSPGVTLCLKNKSVTIHEQQLPIRGTDSSGYYSAISEGVVWDFDCTDADKLDIVIIFKGQIGAPFTDISGNIRSYIYQETQSTNTYLGKDGLTISGPSSIIKISESNATMMYGTYGFRISSEGIQKTSDAGVTGTTI